MWLSSSSIGRKFIMAITGVCLVLFVTFHCLMNSVAIVWPAAYNVICEFLGANWYALIASVGLAVLFIIHIIYAVWLTVLNRKARGNDRYLVSHTPAGVEWSSKNMLVLGIVILAFLVVHLIQFWTKMQLQEIRGVEGVIPPAAGTLFLQEAFSLVWTPIVYIIGFVALWFHMNHGFWSMFQTVGWDNTAWIERLKKIGCWWTSIVIALFLAQAIVFTVKANQNFYKEDPTLRNQYIEMVAKQHNLPVPEGVEFDAFAAQVEQTMQQVNLPQMQAYLAQDPAAKAQVEAIEKMYAFICFLQSKEPAAAPEVGMPGMAFPAQEVPAQQEVSVEEETVEAQVAAPAQAEAEAPAAPAASEKETK